MNLKMRIKVPKFINEFYHKVHHFHQKSQESGSDQTHMQMRDDYEDLLPRDDINDPVYQDALDYALGNERITNIAIMGPYGSGKSSIISSYKKTKKLEDKWLEISLATFSLNENEQIGDKEVAKNEIVNSKEMLLERSILQQMFYRVDESKIPFSRFKRITRVTNVTIFKWMIILLVLVIGLLSLFKDNFLNYFIKPYLMITVSKIPMINIFLGYGISIAVLLTAFSITFSLIRFLLKRMKVSKISIKQATIEKKSAKDSSVFNRYIDEILYFFESTEFNVVVFEDLDRFESLNIFENLRELNFLINNAEQVHIRHKRIVFVYALKDNIFGNKDSIDISRNRTKFFDFVLPVIPIINSSNSSEVLKDKLNSIEGIDKRYIEQLTYYIDDMRMLINTCNEFNVYRNKLSLELDPNKLLAMIVYKNVYPIDFSELQFNKGIIYQVLNDKDKLINQALKEVTDEIGESESLIDKAKNEILNNVHELRYLYVAELGLLDNSNSWIQINGQQYNENNFDKMFEGLKNTDQVNYFIKKRYPYSQRNASKEEIATVFNTKPNYFDREKAILS